MIENIGSCLMLAMTGVVATAVFLRYVFGFSFMWSEEATRYIFIYIIFLASAIATYKKGHIRVVFFLSLLPEKLRNTVTLIVNLFIAVMYLFIILGGVELMRRLGFLRSYGMGIRMVWFYWIIPFSFFIMLLNIIPRIMEIGKDLMHSSESKRDN